MIDIRRELRDVKLAMRKDIDNLHGVLKIVNIAGVPALIGLGALALGWSRRRRRPDSGKAAPPPGSQSASQSASQPAPHDSSRETAS